MARPTVARWVGIVLRAMHLVSVILLGAALMHGTAAGAAVAATLASGLALFLLDTWQYPRHLVELSGAAVLAKLAVVGVMAVDESLRLPLYWTVVLWSVVFSHAPASLRHARLTRAGIIRRP